MNSPSVSVAFRQSSEARGKYHGSSLLIVWAVTVPRRVCLIFSASACLFPRCFVSVGEGMSYSNLDLVIKHKYWMKQNKWLFCCALVYASDTASLKVFLGKRCTFWSAFLPQNICSLLKRQM